MNYASENLSNGRIREIVILVTYTVHTCESNCLEVYISSIFMALSVHFYMTFRLYQVKINYEYTLQLVLSSVCIRYISHILVQCQYHYFL